jgi:RecJ-like exonuclease
MTTFKHLTYEEWVALYPEAAKEEEDCEECDGQGEVECFECGHIRECQECGGTGKSKSARNFYEEQVERDEKAMAKYLEKAGVAE